VRKRSKYRPKPVLANTLGFVLEGMQPAANVAGGSYLLDLKIKNHDAIDALRRGEATRAQMDTLIAMNNMTEALFRMGFGSEYGAVVAEGYSTMKEVCGRFARDGRVTLYPKELIALNAHLELHDAQMDVITVKDVERAINMINQEVAQKRAFRIQGDRV
jgi:hypothetical protein